MDKTLYHIYEESRDGLAWIHDLHAEDPEEALEKAVEGGYIPSGERFTVIADSNHVKRTSPEAGPR